MERNTVKSNDGLNILSQIKNHTEYSSIYLEFSNNFKLENIADEIIVSMLDNIENRLLYIATKNNNYFILIRRTLDNVVIKNTLENKVDDNNV